MEHHVNYETTCIFCSVVTNMLALSTLLVQKNYIGNERAKAMHQKQMQLAGAETEPGI